MLSQFHYSTFRVAYSRPSCANMASSNFSQRRQRRLSHGHCMDNLHKSLLVCSCGDMLADGQTDTSQTHSSLRCTNGCRITIYTYACQLSWVTQRVRVSQIAIRGKRQCQQNESEFCNASRVWSSCNNYCFFLFQKETLTKCFLQTALYWPHHFFWPPALPASTTAAVWS